MTGCSIGVFRYDGVVAWVVEVDYVENMCDADDDVNGVSLA